MNSRQLIVMMTLLGLVAQGAIAQEHDYYKNLPYQKGLVPGVGLDKIEQQGGPNAAGYNRRTVQWWPRKGQDIVDIPKGVPLRTWTRDKGQIDKKAEEVRFTENGRRVQTEQGKRMSNN